MKAARCCRLQIKIDYATVSDEEVTPEGSPMPIDPWTHSQEDILLNCAQQLKKKDRGVRGCVLSRVAICTCDRYAPR